TDRDDGDTWRHRRHEPGSAARAAAMMRDLEDLRGHSTQGVLPGGLDVPGQQERDPSPAQRQHQRIVVAGGPRRTAWRPRALDVDRHAVPIVVDAAKHRPAGYAARVERGVEIGVSAVVP